MDPEFVSLYERELPAVTGSVYLLCGDRGLAEEAAQEAFARALASWRRLGSKPWAAGWVTTTALNVARRQLRRRPAPSPNPAPAGDLEEHLDVRAAVGRLPARQQEAVVLHYLLDLSVIDVAATMGCNEGTVKRHLSRARVALARALGADGPASDTRRNDRA